MLTEGIVNNVDVPADTQPNNENVEITHDALQAKMTDQQFADAVTSQITRATTDADKVKLKQRQLINYKYWKGEQINTSELRDDLEKSVENVIFQDIETFIPIATARTPEITVTPAYKNQQTREFGLNVKRIGQTEWEVYQGMPKLVARGIRNHQMNFVAVFQLGYDPETDEFWTEEIVATDCVISKDGSFFARYIKNKTLGYLLDTFPEKEKAILEKLGYKSTVTDELRASPVEYLEAWTDEVMGWKLQDLVLGVSDNPHFDYTGTDYTVGAEPMLDEAGQPMLDDATGELKMQDVTKTVKFNHFKKPRMPILFMNYWTRGVSVYDETTLIEQAIGPQDWINKRKRQIGANADSTNGHWVSSGDFISKEEFDKIEGGIDEKIWLESGKPQDGFIKLTGAPLPDYIYTDLVDSRGSLDRLMGIEQATRGESTGNKTLGQDVMQRQQNNGRIDGYVRHGIESFAQQWYEYMYHLNLVYRIEEKSIAIPEDDDFESDNVIFCRDYIPLIHMKNGDLVPVPLVLRVKQGSTLPMDDVFEYNKVQANKEMYAPIDWFKKMGEANPRELAKNALINALDPTYFFKDDPDIQLIVAKQAAAAEQAAAAVAQKDQAERASTLSIAEMDNASKEKIAATKAGAPGPDGKPVAPAPAPSVVQPTPDAAPAPGDGEDVTPKGVGNAVRAIAQEKGIPIDQLQNAAVK